MKLTLGPVFVLLLVLTNIMGSVRYILRWGDPNSSHPDSNYTPVPTEYFLIWNILTLTMAILVLFNFRTFSQRALLGYLIMLVFVISTYLQSDSFYVHGAAKGLICNGFFFVILFSNNRWLDIKHFNKAIEFMSLYGIAYIAFQVYQYLTLGILPTHSHKGHLMRFGSYYDDSLVWGALLPMFAGYYFYKYRKTYSQLLIGIIFNFLAILTGSLTAIGVAAIYTCWVYRLRPILILTYLIIGMFSAIYYKAEVQKLVAFKEESICLHLAAFDKIQNIDFLAIIGLKPLDTFTESGFLLLLLNFGLPVLLLVLIIHIATIFSIRSQLVEHSPAREFSGATEGLTFSVMLFSFNLPAIIISPVYLFIAIFSAIAIGRAAQNVHIPHSNHSTP